MLELKDGRYTLQGIPILDLVGDYGAPLYVYDAATIRAQYDRLRNAFTGLPVRIKYAAKALTNPAVLKLLRTWGAGLDTVSIHEVEIGLGAGFAPGEIIFTPNGVSFEEIRAAVDRGVMVNLDNLSMLERFGHAYGGTVPCCVRLNPHILAGGNGSNHQSFWKLNRNILYAVHRNINLFAQHCLF